MDVVMVTKEDLIILKKITLKNANVVMAFSGWPDAKRVATYAAEYLRDSLKAEKIGEIDQQCGVLPAAGGIAQGQKEQG